MKPYDISTTENTVPSLPSSPQHTRNLGRKPNKLCDGKRKVKSIDEFDSQS